MARNGSGTMNPISNSWYPPVNGQLAAAGDWQAIYLDLIAALTQSLSRDGQGPMTGNLQMGGNKITGQGAADGTGQALIYEQLFNQGTEADLASAATTDIGAQLTNFLRITGTTTITSFGTNYKGPRFLRFAGAVLLTNSSTLVLPGGANITTAAGDCCIVIPKATLGTSDGWYVAAYSSAAGIVVNTANITNKAVTYAKIQDVTAGKVLGRDTSGNGAVQELPIAVDASGNVGIGTSSPVTKLDVAGAIRISAGSDYGTYTVLYDGNLASYEIAFRTGVNNARTERARIDSSGNLLVGSSTLIGGVAARLAVQQGSNPYASIFQVTGSSGIAALFHTASTGGVGSISLTSATTSYNTTSDYRLKENIAPMTGALSVVQQLKPCTYKWKVDGSDGQGFIAHELQEVVPDCVTGEKDAVDADDKPIYQGIDTSFLVATLTAAIQEQQAIITSLTARIEALEGGAA